MSYNIIIILFLICNYNIMIEQVSAREKPQKLNITTVPRPKPPSPRVMKTEEPEHPLLQTGTPVTDNEEENHPKKSKDEEEYVGIPIKPKRSKTKTNVLMNNNDSESDNEPNQDNIHTFEVVSISSHSDDEQQITRTKSRSKRGRLKKMKESIKDKLDETGLSNIIQNPILNKVLAGGTGILGSLFGMAILLLFVVKALKSL